MTFLAQAAAEAPWYFHPAFVSLIVAAPTAVYGYKNVRRTARLDKEATQAAVIKSHEAALQMVIDGLDRLVDNLQSNNVDVRAHAASLREQLAECHAAYAELKRLTDDR